MKYRASDEVATYIKPNLQPSLNFRSPRRGRQVGCSGSSMEVRRIILSGALIVLLALTLVGAVLIRSIAHPITDLATVAIQLARGNRSVNIPALANYDETGDVANALLYFRKIWRRQTGCAKNWKVTSKMRNSRPRHGAIQLQRQKRQSTQFPVRWKGQHPSFRPKKFGKRLRHEPSPHSPALQMQFPLPISQQTSQLTCETL